MKRLWEVEHPYYCEESNYFGSQSDRQTIFEFKSWADFIEEMGGADKDYNFLFRWDWDEDETDDGKPTYTGDDYYRNGKLKLFFMHQRKGFHSASLVEVCRADEPTVIEYLSGHWKHMQTMWEPFTAADDNTHAAEHHGSGEAG